MTPEQLEQKLRLTIDLEQHYEKIINSFLQQAAYGLPEVFMLMTTLYGVNREELLLKTVQTLIERKLKILQERPDPMQMSLF